MLRRSLGADIEIEIVASPDLWQTNADRSQLENSIINLAVNARDAMPEGGKLTIETANTYLDSDYAHRNPGVTPDQYVLLEVSDTGTGMEAEVADRAFEPFFTTKEVDKGSGLGLSMIYGFARQSGGHVMIFSAENHRTSVWLCLPKAEAEAEETTAMPAAAPSQLPRGHETILVVEDNAAVLEVVITQLERLGYRVVAAEDGPAALGRTRQPSETYNRRRHEPILVITTRRLMPLFGSLGSARSDSPAPLASRRTGSMWN